MGDKVRLELGNSRNNNPTILKAGVTVSSMKFTTLAQLIDVDRPKELYHRKHKEGAAAV
jgi:hypothetical protein